MSEFLGNIKGPQGEPGRDGRDGIGIPAGGLPGSRLLKKTSTDYDTVWEHTIPYNETITSLDDIPDNSTGVAFVDESIWGGSGTATAIIEQETITTKNFESENVLAILEPVIFDNNINYYLTDYFHSESDLPTPGTSGVRQFLPVSQTDNKRLYAMYFYTENNVEYIGTLGSLDKVVYDNYVAKLWYDATPGLGWTVAYKGRKEVTSTTRILGTNIPLFRNRSEAEEYLTTGDYSKAINNTTVIKRINMTIYENQTTIMVKQWTLNPETGNWDLTYSSVV